ncbi:hypothetical protein [Paenibacillus sp. FSL H3-0286]|uniref:hypothetical protein n=1 Tax=Paenibacillus sp. FSL H3-0286 TaxID=2921427 RepID=UPI00324DCFFE
MSDKTFLEQCLEPVSIEKVRKAAHRIMEGKARISQGFNAEDDDTLLLRAIDELERYRNEEV